jgi:oxygen-independent coproporphyrinogen-3 oxidase
LQPFNFVNNRTESLVFENIQELGLYVHIPFCRTLCSFCPYCKVSYDQKNARRYRDALIKEIELVGSQMSQPKEATSLYFGGGTPALMADDLEIIIQTLKKYFCIREGIGIELHPDDITLQTLKKLKAAGITMISVGIQSFHQDCLSALGRKAIDYAAVFNLIQTTGFDVVDVDLIFGLPNQTGQILLEDVKRAFINGATQISTYPFIDFTFANNKYQPLPEREKRKILQAISVYCAKNHYERTSVWTFARPHTDKYSSITRDNFLGFGVSAATLLKEQFKINTFSLEGYIGRINNNKLPTSLTLKFSLRQRAVYYLFWKAYSLRINPNEFKEYFGVALSSLFGLELWICRLLGWVEKDKGGYQLTDKGAYYYHYIEQAYTTAYIDKMWNISRHTAFPKRITLK